jgi:hypothetical protein
MNNIEKIIRDALLANGYSEEDSNCSAEETATIILFELEDNGILVPVEDSNEE